MKSQEAIVQYSMASFSLTTIKGPISCEIDSFELLTVLLCHILVKTIPVVVFCFILYVSEILPIQFVFLFTQSASPHSDTHHMEIPVKFL